MAEEKSNIADINREFYDFRYEESEKDFYRIEAGLNPEIVSKLSEEKGLPRMSEGLQAFIRFLVQLWQSLLPVCFFGR